MVIKIDKIEDVTVLEDQDPEEQLIGIQLFNKGDYIGMFTGDYLLLSNGFVKGNQVYYDAEEAVSLTKAIQDIKKQVR